MHRRLRLRIGLIVALIPLLVSGLVVQAQEDGENESQPPGQTQLPDLLYITGSSSSSAPVIDLQLYGMNGRGEPLSILPDNVSIAHGGTQVATVETAGQVDGGTFTVFVVDLAPGIDAQLGAISAAIQNFASPPTMQEQLDYIAIYQIGDQDAVQLLAPTPFYNEAANLLVDPFQVYSGPTALVDSLGNLLGEIEAIKPDPSLATSLVVMTDGTDVVSSQYGPDELPILAASKGIPVHTVHLTNANLGSPDAGRDFLRQLAEGSRGLAGDIETEGDLNAIWNRIASLRSRTVLRYTVLNPVGGEHTVVVSLMSEPSVRATTTVNFPVSAPSVTINLPPESRELTLESLDETVRLRLSATVTWLDGTTRGINQAELYVNDLKVQDLDPANLASFTAEISQFMYGPNTVQILLQDEQEMRAASPKITLNVAEGKTQIPEDIEGEGPLAGVLRSVLICLGILLAAAVVMFVVWRFGRVDLSRLSALAGAVRLPKRRSRRRRSEPEWSDELIQEFAPETPISGAYLEVLESVTRVDRFMPLAPVETRIGRSPAQTEVTFENDITASRLHASIIFSDGEYRLYDEQSTSGTLLNGQSLPDYGAPLIDGDEIRFGAVRVIFRLGRNG